MQCDTKTQIWNSQYAGHFGGHWIKDGLVASSRPRRVGSRRTRPVCQRLSTCRSPTVRRDRYTQRKRPHSRRWRASGSRHAMFVDSRHDTHSGRPRWIITARPEASTLRGCSDLEQPNPILRIQAPRSEQASTAEPHPVAERFRPHQ